jgi:hypothetical protein
MDVGSAIRSIGWPIDTMEGSAPRDSSWITGGNGRRVSITERCAACKEGNALKGATPRAPLA